MDILIADDDRITCRLLKNMLEQFGHSVRTVSGGREALEAIRKDDIRMVITDWVMPEMDGPQLCRALRREEGAGYVYILMLTSKDGKEDIIAGLEAGADDYLSKPFHHAELMARLKTGVRILELERSLRQANDDIRTLSVTDSLTGCFNRGYLAERLPAEVKRARRYGRSLSAVICDMDHFKRINDTWGHPAGDAVLADFGKRLTAAVRKDLDWVVRFGGEEFLLVLPETPIDGAVRAAERIRAGISEAPVRYRGIDIPVTASFGASELVGSPEDPEQAADDLLRTADRALYAAKAAGRNRVHPVDTADEGGLP
ncbi:MAG: diguanylate cyclase [Desulfobacterales bacterium]|nr:diguanylate cyclase [Desulfobacterales bacterium]